MKSKYTEQRYTVTGVSLPIRASKDEVFGIAEKSFLKFFSKDEIKNIKISKRSVDARNKSDIKFVYNVSAVIRSSKNYSEERLKSHGITVDRRAEIKPVAGSESLSARPVVVGFGPCGMFCAYYLAKYGYRPIVIERGSDTLKRSADVYNFKTHQILNTESNIQFGAGGAGTFSDGKLMTRINDPFCAEVIDTFHKFGAPDDILLEAKPHIGTDHLCGVVDRMRDEIISLGGEIFFDTKLTGVEQHLGKVTKIFTTNGEFNCGALVLAIGHSARDTVKMLQSCGIDMTAKPFSVGARIEHLQKDIDYAMFGKESDSGILPHAEYAISAHIGQRGVYTFCMCPGGEVAAAASEEFGIVTNGMSNHARNGKNANSAVCVSVLPEDFGGSIDGAMNFVRNIEQAAYKAAANTYFAPAQTVGSFLGKMSKNEITSVVPTYMNGKVSMVSLDRVLPEFVSSSLKGGIAALEKKIRGFSANDAVLTAPETRTSSPVRIVRSETFLSIGFENIYPCGEGAGYAGGITSAAVDGIKCAIKIIERYKAN